MIAKYSQLKKANMSPVTFREKMPYVVVFHNPTGKMFFLNRNYKILDISLQLKKEILEKNSVNKFEKWFPSSSEQSPDWAKNFPESEFTAYFLYSTEGKNSPANTIRQEEMTPEQQKEIEKLAEKWVKSGHSFFTEAWKQ